MSKQKYELPGELDAAINELVEAAKAEGLASSLMPIGMDENPANSYYMHRRNAQAHLARLISEALSAVKSK